MQVLSLPLHSTLADICTDGNGTSIFTNNGATARYFERSVEAGQIGINVPIPVPVPTFAWSGNKASVLGGHSLYGKLYVALQRAFSRARAGCGD